MTRASTRQREPAADRHEVPGSRNQAVVRIGPFSGVVRIRGLLVVAAVLAAGLAALAVNLGRGEFPIPVPDVLQILAGGGQQAQQFIVLQLRLPRSLTAALVGAALAVSGAITQSVSRNPLASPDILGITVGASAGAVTVIVLGGGFTGAGLLPSYGIPLAAIAGGLIATVLIATLAWRQGLDSYRLVLVGIGIAAIGSSVISWMLIVADLNDAARALVWTAGSLNARGWEDVVPVAVALALLLPLVLLLSRALGALQLDDDTVRGLGLRLQSSRTVLVLLAAVLASVATAATGPIAFVALICPQIAMRLAGTSRPPLVASALLGTALTVWSDVIARAAIGGLELPVGVVTASIGAPYLLWLLVRQQRRTRG